MIFAICALAICSAWLEWEIIHGNWFLISPLARWLIKKRLRRIIFSVVLSALLGRVFGAVGLITLVGGILSTLIIQPAYAAEQNQTVVHQVQKFKSKSKERKANIDRRFRQAASIVNFVWTPFAILFKIVGWFMDRVPERNLQQ